MTTVPFIAILHTHWKHVPALAGAPSTNSSANSSTGNASCATSSSSTITNLVLKTKRNEKFIRVMCHNQQGHLKAEIFNVLSIVLSPGY